VTSAHPLKHVPRHFVRAGIWVSTAIVLLVCILFARLFFAPINLDFARSTLLERANEFFPGWQVSYETAMVGWDWSAVRPWVVLEDIQLIDRRNRLNATIPEARIVISASSLFTGISLSTIDVNGAHMNVTDIGGFSDATDDSLFDDLFAGGLPKPEVFKPVTEAFSRFAVRLIDNAPRLEAVNFTSFSLDLARGEALSVFSVSAPSFRLERFRERLQLAAQIDADLANTPTRIRLSGNAEPAVGALALTLSFSDLSPLSLSEAIEVPQISFMNFPFGLDLQLDMTSAQGLRLAAFEVSIGEGELRHPVQYPDGSPVDYGIISAAYDVEKELLTFSEIELSFGGNVVRGDGIAFWQEGFQRPGLRFNLGIDRVTVADVQKYWPIKTHPDGRPRGARAWIDQNMFGGIAKNARFNVSLDPDGRTPYKNGSIYEAVFDFEDIETLYLKDMPPIKGAGGHAVLTRTEFDAFLDSGSVEGMPITGSKAHLYNIHKRGKGIGEFDVKLSGDVFDILTLVSVPPVRIKDRIKMDLERIGGTANISAKISLPLIKAAPKELVDYTIEATVADGRVRNLLKGEGLTEASVVMKLDKNDLTASGHGKINSVPLDLYWRENFAAGRHNLTADTSLLVMSGITNQNDLKNLGVDVLDYVDGAMLMESTFLGRSLKFRVGYFSADASETKLMVPQLGWQKDVAAPANINGTVFFEKSGPRIAPLTVSGEKIDLEAALKWGAAGTSDFTADFIVRQLGRSQMVAKLKGIPGGGVDAKVTAERFDLAPLLARDKQSRRNDEGLQVATAKDEPPFKLALTANELLMLNGASLQDVKLDLSFENSEPASLTLTSENELKKSSISITKSDDELSAITVTSDEAGSLLRGLGLFAHMEGGALTLEGETSGWGDKLQLLGTLEVANSELVAKSKLGPDITEGVISGLDDYLEGGSIDLDVLEFPFVYQEGLLDLSGVKANGPSLGMTMEGQIDTQAGKINVNGVVVPAYGLNSLLGKIPLVGGLFSGGEGKGLFGVAYRVIGLTEEPEVIVNPLSGIAPGFLRLLFEGKKGSVDDVKSPEDVKNPEDMKNPKDMKKPEATTVPEADAAAPEKKDADPANEAATEKGEEAEPAAGSDLPAPEPTPSA